MSMEKSYRRMTTEEFERLRDDPAAAALLLGFSLELLDDPEKLMAQFEAREADERYLNIGKDWHALHFLLTGDAELRPHPLPPPPLGDLVFGGSETPWDETCGTFRSLSPDEVRAMAEALSAISVEELRSRFSVESFNSGGIYPHGRRARWTPDDIESLFETYPRLVELFRAAALAGEMVLRSSE